MNIDMNIGIYVNHLTRRTFNTTAISIMGYQFYKAFSNMGHKTLIIANKNINEMDENIDFVSLSGKVNGEVFTPKD